MSQEVDPHALILATTIDPRHLDAKHIGLLDSLFHGPYGFLDLYFSSKIGLVKASSISISYR
jgi:hypothetical protein